MSSFASNLASLARSKLHSAVESGSRDNLSLHRWVLLKNSIIIDISAPASPIIENELCAPSLVGDVGDDADAEEEDEMDMDLYAGMSGFLFPDPGDADLLQPSQNGAVGGSATSTEAQWFDSLFETLADEDDDDEDHQPIRRVSLPPVVNHHHLATLTAATTTTTNANAVSSPAAVIAIKPEPTSSELVSPASSCCEVDEEEEYSSSSPSSIAVPYPVPYPPLVKPYGVDDAAHDDDDDDINNNYYSPRPRSSAIASRAVPYFLPFSDLDDSYLSMPDAVEDNASEDDTDSELPSTPFFNRSRSSFSSNNSNLSLNEVGGVRVDPASIPLPRDSRSTTARSRSRVVEAAMRAHEPRIYSSADDVCFPFAHEPVVVIPNPDMLSDSTPVYTPTIFYQNC